MTKVKGSFSVRWKIIPDENMNLQKGPKKHSKCDCVHKYNIFFIKKTV